MAEAGLQLMFIKATSNVTAYKNLGFDIKDYPNAFNMYKMRLHCHYIRY